jgi:hypothetical protein
MSASREHAGAATQQHPLVARLRRLPKRYFALALLLPVLVVLWLPLLTGKSKSRPAAATAATADAAVAAAPAAETAVPAGAEAPAATPIEAAAELNLRVAKMLEPFEPRWREAADPVPFRAPAVIAAETLAAADAELVPTTIVLSSGQAPIAIIDGQAWRPGDSIGDRTIVAIEERRVLFREGNKTYAVSLPEARLRKDP